MQKNIASTEMKTATSTKIKSLIAKKSENQHLVSECATRALSEKSTIDTLRILTAFTSELTSSDVIINDKYKIASRNQKAIEKVTKFLRMFRTNIVERNTFDSYSATLIKNAMNHKKSLDTALQNASLSISLECASMSAKDTRKHVAASTASTQRSSSCYALHAVNLADYDNKTCVMTVDTASENYKIFKKIS